MENNLKNLNNKVLNNNNHPEENPAPSRCGAGIFNPLKFLFVSLESLSGDLAWHLKKEGHLVKAYIKKKADVDVYDGFIEKVEAWQPYQEWADVICFDDVEFGEIADHLRQRGKLVIGGSKYTDELEINREFGQMEMRRYGINILPQWNFSNYDEAINFIRQNPARYVFKPSGNILSGGKGLLFLGEEDDARDLLELLGKNKDIWQKKAPVFQLQKYVSGVEIAVGAFFNGKDFIYPININFEHKRLFPGNMGPFVGEMGTLMYWSTPNKLFNSTLAKMKPALAEANYRGYIDINCIVNSRGIYPLEFTSRFGFPTIQIQQEGILNPIGESLYKLAKGEDFVLKTKHGFQVGVRILVPSYLVRSKAPDVKAYQDLPILFKRPGNLEGVHIEDVKLVDGVWRVAGTSGCLLVITGSGSTVAQARQQAYHRLKNIKVQNMFYRVDIGLRWLEDSDRLQSWGYL